MQKITITSRLGELIISDMGESMIDGISAPIQLINFDPNSQSTVQITTTCVNMPGQHTISSKLAPKNIKIDIVFDGKYKSSGIWKSGGVKKMFDYRRKILTRIPINEPVEVAYTNDNFTYYITARLIEIPVFLSKSSMCSASLFLVADYPYWYKATTGNEYTVTADSEAGISVNAEGDIGSPVICTITCLEKITGNTTGEFFSIAQSFGGSARMRFVKNLNVGQKLMFNSGLNNEVWVKLVETDGTETLANNYVLYNDSQLLINNVGETIYRIKIFGTSGSLKVQFQYQNLYIGV